MTAPWEETWTIRHSSEGKGDPVVELLLGGISVGRFGEYPDEPRSRARLAAAAPEMARLLAHITECGSDSCQDRIKAVLKKAGVLP